MNEVKPFRPLQAPIAVALSAFAIITLRNCIASTLNPTHFHPTHSPP